MLKDQNDITMQMKEFLREKNKGQESSWEERGTSARGYRIDRMKEIATKTHASVSSSLSH